MPIVRSISKKLLTEQEFMRRVQQSIFRQRNVQQKEEALIESLMQQVVRQHAPRIVSDIFITATSPFDDTSVVITFTIAKIFPDIDWKVEKIRWKYFGYYSDGTICKEGSIYEDEINKLPGDKIDQSENSDL